LSGQDNSIGISKNNNKEVVNEHNNFDSQTCDNNEEITRLNNSTIKNIYDLSQ